MPASSLCQSLVPSQGEPYSFVRWVTEEGFSLRSFAVQPPPPSTAATAQAHDTTPC